MPRQDPRAPDLDMPCRCLEGQGRWAVSYAAADFVSAPALRNDRKDRGGGVEQGFLGGA